MIVTNIDILQTSLYNNITAQRGNKFMVCLLFDFDSSLLIGDS